jgi:hypothetical protein
MGWTTTYQSNIFAKAAWSERTCEKAKVTVLARGIELVRLDTAGNVNTSLFIIGNHDTPDQFEGLHGR